MAENERKPRVAYRIWLLLGRLIDLSISLVTVGAAVLLVYFAASATWNAWQCFIDPPSPR